MLNHSEKTHLRTVLDENSDDTARTFVVFSVGLDKPSWVLRDEFGVQTFPTLEKFFRTLGSMVQWDRWDTESRDWILGLNGGKPIG